MFRPSLWLILPLLFLRVPLEAAEDPKIFAHYMPWYSSKPLSGDWGWHWSMDHYDPEVIRWNGRREAASHDSPLIGLYDSSDPHALECHVLLMKLAGIDGVIVDWYGIQEGNDYPMIHRNTRALIPWLKKAGLQFAICYEDQSKEKSKDPIGDVRKDLQWMAENWFEDEAYLKTDEKPILLVFGPQKLSGNEWIETISTLPSAPTVFTLPHLKEKTKADGVFGWPPVDEGRNVAVEDWNGYLEKLYSDSSNIGVVFPGFNDIYKQAGISDSYGRIDDRNGATFSETLERALKSKPPLIQIATWNDFGEGTVIEPTKNLGYRYLDTLQEKTEPGFSSADLRLPALLYRLRKKLPESPELNKAAEMLFQGEIEQALPLLEKLSTQLKEQPVKPNSKYRLASDVAYREGEDLTNYEKDRCRLDVYFPSGSKPYATVIWFHGGGIQKGNKEIPVPLRNKGIAVVAPNYRLNPKVKSPDYIEDAAAAVAWTIKNINRYGAGRSEGVFVSGHSAGGYLASMVGLDKKYLSAHGIDTKQIAGLIPFSGHTITHFTIRRERGISGNQPVIDELAPLFHVRKDTPPILLITGDREMELMGRYEENAYFWRMMQVVKHPDATLRELQGYDHVGMPEPAFPLLLEFMENHFDPAP